MGNSLYSERSAFKIIIGEEGFYIDEPIGWDNVLIVLQRDVENCGFMLDFVDDNTPLKFASTDVAYTILKNLREEKGSDAVSFLVFGTIVDGVFTQQYKGYINLNNYERTKSEITCSVDKVEFNNDFRTKYETKVDLTKTVSLDESVIVVPPTPIDISLHSKAIFKQFISQLEMPISFDSGNIARFFSLKFDSTIEIVSELEGNQNLPLSINGINPVEQGLYFFKTTESGKYNIKGDYSFVFTMIRKPATFPIGNYAGVIRLRVFREGVAIYDYAIDSFSGNHSGSTKGVFLSHTFEYLSMDILKDDLFYFYMDGACQYAGSTYQYLTTDFVCKIEIEALTDAPETIAKGYAPFDVITKLVEYTTNRMLAVKSEFLENGFGAKFALIYGFSMRNFIPAKPFITSIQDFVISMSAINGLGLGFKNIGLNSYIIIEPLAYFFRGERMLTINSISNFKDETAKDFIFNDMELGYDKYAEGETNSLDEFNTYYQWLEPIKTFKQKFIKKSKYILSGYSIEQQRREQFAVNPSVSLSNDDEIFAVSTIEKTGSVRVAERDENFTNIEGLISPETSYNIVASPLRIFWAWIQYILISVDTKEDAELIKNTFIKNNDKLKSESLYTGADRRNEPNGLLIEKSDTTLGDARAETPQFHKSMYSYFETELDYDTLTMLRRYLTDEVDGEPKNMGFIKFVDDQGKYWDAHVYKITYKPKTRIAQFKVCKIKLSE